MSTVSEQIIQNSNYSEMAKASQALNSTTSEASSTVSSNDFLNLMCMQLEYQDPTDPTDNSEMLAQEAQFTSLEYMENLSSSFTSFSNMYQANSLLGQKVEVNSDNGTVVGKVDYVDYSDTSGAAVSINGTTYPLSSVTKVYPAEETNSSTDSSNNSVVESLLSGISDNIGSIASKLTSYLSEKI